MKQKRAAGLLCRALLFVGHGQKQSLFHPPLPYAILHNMYRMRNIYFLKCIFIGSENYSSSVVPMLI